MDIGNTLEYDVKYAVTWMVLKTFNRNAELNAGLIIASSNINTTVPLEPAGDKQTKVDGIPSLTHV